jgi:hypothetical protein
MKRNKPAAAASENEKPRVIPPWLQEAMPVVGDEIEPEAPKPPKYYKAGPDAPTSNFPFVLREDDLPPATTQLRVSSIPVVYKLDVTREKGFFMRRQMAKRAEEIGEDSECLNSMWQGRGVCLIWLSF